MARRCSITERGPQVGHNVSHAHNVTKRRYNINLQRVRVLIDGKVQHIRVSTKAIKSGLIEKPPIKLREHKKRRFEFEAPPLDTTAALAAASDASDTQYFSSASVVWRVFKPKQPKSPVGTEAAAVAEAAATVPAESPTETATSPAPPETVATSEQSEASTDTQATSE